MSKRKDTMNNFEWRVRSSEARTGRPVVLSPYIPETILRFSDYHNRWQARNPRTNATAFHAQVVWEYFNGPIPDGYVVHHKNGHASEIEDDRPENLMLLKKDINHRLFPTLAKELGVSEEVITEAYVEAEGNMKRFLSILGNA